MISLIESETGAVSASYTYGPFGELLTRTGTYAAANPFGFSTKYRDAETGLLYYGFRYYSPELGRWPSRDPIGIDGGLNLYAMVDNNPVCYVDYLGLLTEYNSSDEAARAALAEAKRLTRESDDKSKARANPIFARQKDRFPRGSLGIEYGGLICSKKSCEKKYTYTGPIAGDSGSVNPDKAPCPEGWSKSGEYHTHPGGGKPSREADLPRSNKRNEDGSKQKNYVGDGREGGGDDYSYGPGEPGPGGIPTYDVQPFK